jgi:hypothetical protein
MAFSPSSNITKLPAGEGQMGPLKVFACEIAGDTYVTGGWAIPAQAVAMGTIHGAHLLGVDTDAVGYVPQYNFETGKLMVFQTAGFTPAGTNSKPTFTVKNGTAVANGTINLDADAASANVVGGSGITADRTLTTTSPVGTPTFTGTAVAKAALAEVTNSTNLSALRFRFLFVGD